MTAPTLARPAPATGPCPPWCDGTCAEWRDEDGNTYHGSRFTAVDAVDHSAGPIELTISTTRLDTPAGLGEPLVHLLAVEVGQDLTLTVAQARRLAAALLDAADTEEVARR